MSSKKVRSLGSLALSLTLVTGSLTGLASPAQAAGETFTETISIESATPAGEKTIFIPDIDQVTSISVDNGTVSYVQDMDSVTVKADQGQLITGATESKTATRSQVSNTTSFPASMSYGPDAEGYAGTLYPSGSYVPNTYTIPGQIKTAYKTLEGTTTTFPYSYSYSDADGYTGTLYKSGSVTSTNSTLSITATGSRTSSTNSFPDTIPYSDANGYSGTLSKSGTATSSTTTVPGASKSATSTRSSTGKSTDSCSAAHTAAYNVAPASVSYSDGSGYTGTLYKSSYAAGSCSYSGLYAYANGTVTYSGTVYQPGTTSTVWRQSYSGTAYKTVTKYFQQYAGEVKQPSQTYTDYTQAYSGTVTRKLPDKYRYNVTLTYNTLVLDPLSEYEVAPDMEEVAPDASKTYNSTNLELVKFSHYSYFNLRDYIQKKVYQSFAGTPGDEYHAELLDLYNNTNYEAEVMFNDYCDDDYCFDGAYAPIDQWRIAGFLKSSSGFSASAFKNPRTKEIVVAFRGTEIKDAEDLKADIELATNRYVKQSADAKKFLIAIKKAYPDYKLTFTGHSLGGWMASYMTVMVKERNLLGSKSGYLKTVTFNAPGFYEPGYFTEDEWDHIRTYPVEKYIIQEDWISDGVLKNWWEEFGTGRLFLIYDESKQGYTGRHSILSFYSYRYDMKGDSQDLYIP